jgi:hypothetical protein
VHLKEGSQEAELMAARREGNEAAGDGEGGKIMASREITLKPVKK